MQITNDQARICIFALEVCGISDEPEHDEVWAAHKHLKESLMNDLQFRSMERTGEIPVNTKMLPCIGGFDDALPKAKMIFAALGLEARIQSLLKLNMDCAKAYHAANNLQSQPGDDAALVAAAANFEAALREVVR